MTTSELTVGRPWWRIPQRHVPVLATLALLLVMYAVGVSQYRAFSNVQVIFNVFIDNGFLLVVAVGMTFVILTGGIDLSVGSVVAMTAMVCASLLRAGLPAPLVLVIALLIGPTLGFLMGAVIHFFEVQPFIVTLAGMFFARGMCTFIDKSSIPITDEFWTVAAQKRIGDPRGNFVSISVLIAFAVVLVAAFVLAYTRLGRNVYAIGGNPQSALLMGLPVAQTRIAVYTISGLCAAIGGILLSFYTLSGAPLIAVGMELDVIAAVVIGGTVLTGGSGYVFGTVLGVLVLGVIQTLITFDGTLSSWWTKIVIGGLLFVFILLQRLIGIRKR
ncbi:galactofuranose ABC transporter, permease protein YjfF [Catellatospora tritici]|uniref:galactofuranose ABC transporter, permease protein YjfF n=1 Tax=Catellatospora tritici TaxID=2851566 RepID=UPI001C2D3B56|nr:galactofuranose ABC transporter, permease protein YjfF [Catellatospora tritici]MBV1853210.1 sugar ABC transporter permease YjfF [Catellatospora tritici]